MRNPLARTWRHLFKRPAVTKYVPSELQLDERDPARIPTHDTPRRRKTDQWRA